MAFVDDIADEFELFSNWLAENRREAIREIENLRNGFEGWIKLEFYFWLTTIRKARLEADKDVGLEYNVQLDQRFRQMDKAQKRCDLWVRASGSVVRYHYVELKVPFYNQNSKKVLSSAANDVWYMARLKRAKEQVASGSAIILGVGFEEEVWREAMSYLKEHYGDALRESQKRKEGTIGSSNKIRWRVISQLYC